MTSVTQEPKNVIYGLYCVCNDCATTRPGEIRYVGQTRQSPAKRLRQHIYRAKNPSGDPALQGSRVCNWIRACNFQVEMVILEQASRGDLDSREVHWISKLGTLNTGFNVAQGGIGRFGFAHSNESRKKMRAAFRNGTRRPLDQRGGRSTR